MKSTAPREVGPANAPGAADLVTDGVAVGSTSPVEVGVTVDVGDGSVVAETHDARRLAAIARRSRFIRQMLAYAEARGVRVVEPEVVQRTRIRESM
jgi:hypothetical protein